MNSLTASAFDLPGHLSAKADPALIAGDEKHFAAIAESLEQSIAELSGRLDAERKAPGGIGQAAMDRDMEIHRLTARLRAPAPLRPGPLPRAHGQRGRPRARLRRTARPHGQRGAPAAGRLALPRGRAVLRGDPRQPDGPGQPPPVPLDPRPGQRLLGRGVHPGRAGRARRARRPVRLHRQPGQQPVGPDARRARHHRGRPGRHHPRGIPRRSRRRRRPGYREDRRRPAPHRLPALLRSSPRSPPGRRAVRRTAPALPGLRRRRAAQPRRGRRADLHPAGPRRRGSRGSDRGRPGGGPAEVVRGPGQGDRAGRPVLREAARQADDGRDPLVRHLAERRRLGRGVRRARTRYPAQRGARPDLGGAGLDPDGQARRRRPGAPAPQVAAAERGAAHDLHPRVAADRGGRPRRRPVVGTRLPAHVRSLAQPRGGPAAAAPGPSGLDGVRPAAAGRGTAAARRPGGVTA